MEPADRRSIDEHEYEPRGSLRSIHSEYGSDPGRWIDLDREQFAARDHRQIDHGERSQPRPETWGRMKYRPGHPLAGETVPQRPGDLRPCSRRRRRAGVCWIIL